jgi:hypothetical protein
MWMSACVTLPSRATVMKCMQLPQRCDSLSAPHAIDIWKALDQRKKKSISVQRDNDIDCYHMQRAAKGRDA